VARLRPQQRADLPDRAFAYIDATGRRRLPIHDAGHVRNALARFGQVEFDDDAARDRARGRLLRAAKRFRIVPVGFITSEIRGERPATGARARQLPDGFVTMLMTDIEGSTGLVSELGDGFGTVLDEVCAILRRSVVDAGGFEVEARADEFFAVFDTPRPAVDAAIRVQRELGDPARVGVADVRVRVGIHSGYPTGTGSNYLGLDVNTASRVCAAGHGQQIVVTANTREAVKDTDAAGLRFTSLGTYRLRGLPHDVALYQVGADGLPRRFPPLRIGRQ